MNTIRLIVVTLLSFSTPLSCQNETVSSKKEDTKKVDSTDTTKVYDIEKIQTYTLDGDFDGDREKERLTSKLISSKLQTEIKQIQYPKNNYDHVVFMVSDSLEAYLEIQSKNLRPLIINRIHQILGLYKLVNIGDIDNNGSDEIALIVAWADWSNMNNCSIYSYCQGKWVEKLSIPIHETSINFEKKETEKIEGILEKIDGKWTYWIYNNDSGKNEAFLLKIDAC